MREEIQRIIAHASPVELAMLEDLGMDLPRELLAIAAEYRLLQCMKLKGQTGLEL